MKKLMAITLCCCTVFGGTYALRPRNVEVGALRPRAIQEVESTQEVEVAGMRMIRF